MKEERFARVRRFDLEMSEAQWAAKIAERQAGEACAVVRALRAELSNEKKVHAMHSRERSGLRICNNPAKE